METIISVIAIVISVISVCFALYTFIWTVRRDRKQATLEAYNTLQNEAFDKINLYSPSEIQEFIKHPTSKEYNDVAALVARIEHFCVGVNIRIYDKKTVYSLAHGYFDGQKLKSRILPVIDRKNNNMEYDYYSNTHQVLAWMDKVTEKQRKKP